MNSVRSIDSLIVGRLIEFGFRNRSSAPLRGESRAAKGLALVVDAEIVHDLEEPAPGIALALQLHDGEQECLLDDVPRILLGQAVPPCSAPYERQEEIPMESLQELGRNGPSGRRTSPYGGRGPGRNRHQSTRRVRAT